MSNSNPRVKPTSKTEIIPAIMASSYEDLADKVAAVIGIAKIVQIDAIYNHSITRVVSSPCHSLLVSNVDEPHVPEGFWKPADSIRKHALMYLLSN